jgi:hypothetical protein
MTRSPTPLRRWTFSLISLLAGRVAVTWASKRASRVSPMLRTDSPTTREPAAAALSCRRSLVLEG